LTSIISISNKEIEYKYRIIDINYIFEIEDFLKEEGKLRKYKKNV